MEDTAKKVDSNTDDAIKDHFKAMIAANQWENTVSVIDTTSNSEQEILQVGSTPVAMALSPDGALLSVANRDSSSVTIISTATRNPVATVSLALSPERLAFSADGTRLYVVHPGNDSVSVIDVLAQKYLTSITVGKTPRAIAAIPGTREMYVTNGMSNTVSVIQLDGPASQVVASIPVGEIGIVWGALGAARSSLLNSDRLGTLAAAGHDHHLEPRIVRDAGERLLRWPPLPRSPRALPARMISRAAFHTTALRRMRSAS